MRQTHWIVIIACALCFTACSADDSKGTAIVGDVAGDGNGGGDGVDASSSGGGTPDPGTRILQRLNRAEYNNTIQDLFGVTGSPADDFPTDDRGFGFDNIGAVLSMSPLLIELYERAADEIIEEVMHLPRTEPIQATFEAEEATASVGGAYSDTGWNLWSNGDLTSPMLVTIPEDGEYRLSALAWGQQAGPEVVQMVFLVDGSVVDTIAVDAAGPQFAYYDTLVELRAGASAIGVGFINDYYDQAAGADRNLIVDSFSFEGPLNSTPGENLLRDRVMTCDPVTAGAEACAEEIIRAVGRRAWRRPLEDAEVTRLLGLVQLAEDEGEDFDEGIKLALKAMLISPHFLFKVEHDPSTTESESHPLSDFELATRLAYFLWSSTPDDALLDLAEAGQLQDDATLVAEINRMLDDPRAEALVENFAGQWLHIRAIDEANPDVWYFPDWTDALRDDMRTEAEMNFRAILDGDRDLRSLITGSETYLNARLAAHYGIGGVSGDAFALVDTGSAGRVGWLAQGGLLTSTSYATRTSPVRRGQWVLANLLCREPPAPPPGVEGIPEENPTSATIRERMEQHRADPVCASCHAEMDPIGFAYENFDGNGVWRELDAGNPIDATGELPDGQTFDGAVELSAVLAAEDSFTTCIVEKTMTYAIGRGPSLNDSHYHEAIAEALEADGYDLRALIRHVVLSEPFRTRRMRLD